MRSIVKYSLLFCTLISLISIHAAARTVSFHTYTWKVATGGISEVVPFSWTVC